MLLLNFLKIGHEVCFIAHVVEARVHVFGSIPGSHMNFYNLQGAQDVMSERGENPVWHIGLHEHLISLGFQ